MELLGKIFGNQARVKVMRLFLFNTDTIYTLEDVSRRTRIRKDTARKEIRNFEKIGFLSKKKYTEKVEVKKKKKDAKPTYKKVQHTGWSLNKKFELITPLQNLVIETELINTKDLSKRLKKAGKIELLLLSGIFVRDDNRKLDLLVVGDKLNAATLSTQIAVIESEIGRELAYAHFDLEEFHYRMGMYDKLLRDILENDHTTLINKVIVS